MRRKFEYLFGRYAAFLEEAGMDLMGSQPTQGNIRGGLSTIEEKALGNIAKTGSVPVVDALEPAESPSRSGLNFMDTSSAAGECVTLMGAAGAVVRLFRDRSRKRDRPSDRPGDQVDRQSGHGFDDDRAHRP